MRKDGASQHLGKIPVGWEGEAFPRSTGLSWPALLVTSLQLPARCSDTKHSDVKAFIGRGKQWNRLQEKNQGGRH